MAFKRNADRLRAAACEMTAVSDEEEYEPLPKRGRGAEVLEQETDNARRHATRMVQEVELATINQETGQRIPPRTESLRQITKTVMPAPFTDDDAEKSATADTHCVQYAYSRIPSHEKIVEEFGEEQHGEYCFACEAKNASQDGGDLTDGLVNIQAAFDSNFTSMSPINNVYALHTIYERLIRKPVNDRVQQFLDGETRRLEKMGRSLTPAQRQRIKSAMLPDWSHASIHKHFYTTGHDVNNVVITTTFVLAEMTEEIARTSLFRKNVSTGQRIICPQNIRAYAELSETLYKWSQRLVEQRTIRRESAPGVENKASIVRFGDNTSVRSRKVHALLEGYRV